MNRSPFFTLITASLNSKSTIEKTLESIKSQNFHNFEHIIIDGGSEDGTLSIIKRFEKDYALTCISEPDDGISDALNKGLRHASGTYILIIHADDCLLTPDTLEKVYSIAKSGRYDIYSFPVFKIHPLYGKIPYKPFRIIWWHHFKTIFPHQGCIIHRCLYNRIGGYRRDFSIAMDYDFFYRALMCRSSINFEKRPIALMGGAGISSNQDLLIRRLWEEVRVQDLNERNPFWRLAQIIFRTLYFPYKTRFLPRLKSHFRK